jgi:hypothetical protein
MAYFRHDGQRLAYTVHGDGPRTTVLMPGLLLSQKMQTPLARELADRGNLVVTFDPLGHGASDRPCDRWRYSMPGLRRAGRRATRPPRARQRDRRRNLAWRRHHTRDRLARAGASPRHDHRDAGFDTAIPASIRGLCARDRPPAQPRASVLSRRHARRRTPQRASDRRHTDPRAARPASPTDRQDRRANRPSAGDLHHEGVCWP